MASTIDGNLSSIQKAAVPYSVRYKLNVASLGIWSSNDEMVVITKMRGKFWRTIGFTSNGRDLLYPEEALLLVERGQLVIMEEGSPVYSSIFYHKAIAAIGLPCYLTYTKLKSLDFITVRNKERVISISDERNIMDKMRNQPELSLLDYMASYRVYIHGTDWTKRTMIGMKPFSYVIITTCPRTFSPHIITRLLDEANGVPILFAAISSTGHVQLEEYTDAEKSLSWENDLISQTY
eukprot:gene9947-20682_t